MGISNLWDPLGGRYEATVFATSENHVSPMIWLGLPVALFVAGVVLLMIDQDLFVWWARSEVGPGENITAVSFVVSGILAFIIARRKQVLSVRWLRGAFYVISLMAFFIAGEEWSWGQHFFGWGTPEWLAQVNKQRETNLHNIAENALDQKPRAVFIFTVILVGFLIPLFRRRLTFLDKYPFVDWLLPGRFLIPTTLFICVPRLLERVQLWFDIQPSGVFVVATRDHQELQELYISIFVFLYLLNILLRIKRHRTAAA